jgi:hypothetical protein
MLDLTDRLRHDDPSMPWRVSAVDEAVTRTARLVAAWQLARVLVIHLVEDVLAARACRPTRWPACPACGRLGQSKGFAQRQVTSLFGPLQWHRRVGRCPQGCAIAQGVPFDEELGVQPHRRTSGALQSLGCALAVFVPFATAARLLGWYSGGPVSPRAVWGWVQAAGQRAMAHLQESLEAVAKGDLPTPEPLAAEQGAWPLALGADGVMVPFRPEAGAPTGKTRWREIKVGGLARLDQHRTRLGQVVTRLQHRRLVAVLGGIEALTPRLWCEAVRQGLLTAPQVVWLSDGGRGLWGLFEERFARHATGILDFYHAAQNLWKGAAAWLEGRTTQARTWFAWARHRLRHGMPDGVLADLADALDVEGLPAPARDTLRRVYGYLERHREHINYARDKELGLPLGSGMVERACTWLIHQRFKGVGMRWSEDGFNHLLHLRLAWVNERFETLFVLTQSPNP